MTTQGRFLLHKTPVSLGDYLSGPCPPLLAGHRQKTGEHHIFIMFSRLNQRTAEKAMMFQKSLNCLAYAIGGMLTQFFLSLVNS